MFVRLVRHLSQCPGDPTGNHTVGKLFVTVRCCWNDVSPFDELTSWYLASVIALSLFIFGMMIFWTATSFYVSFLFRPVLFRYVRVIAYVFCRAGVLVCLFVVTVADFGMSLKIGYRILNCIINFWSLILVSIFRLGSPQVLFKVIFCCSYCFICSFLFGIRLCRWLYFIGLRLSEWYNRLCESWAGVR